MRARTQPASSLTPPAPVSYHHISPPRSHKQSALGLPGQLVNLLPPARRPTPWWYAWHAWQLDRQWGAHHRLTPSWMRRQAPRRSTIRRRHAIWAQTIQQYPRSPKLLPASRHGPACASQQPLSNMWTSLFTPTTLRRLSMHQPNSAAAGCIQAHSPVRPQRHLVHTSSTQGPVCWCDAYEHHRSVSLDTAEPVQ